MTDQTSSHRVPRESWTEGLFQILLYYIADKTGNTDFSYDQEFSNDFFSILPYYWGDEEEEIVKPNFQIPSENFELDWYKYPLRNAYATEKLTPRRWNYLIQKCINSLNNEN